MSTTTATPFESALLAAMQAEKRRQRRAGTVSMSAECWLQCTRIPSDMLDGAPRGTNARYYLAETNKRGFTRAGIGQA